MAGHSHFSNIKHKKAAKDAKKAKLFTKIQRKVSVAMKSGSPDPEHNPKLYNAIAEAKYYNLAKDKIESILKKYQNGQDENYEEIRYNGHANGGVYIIVECLTDNKNRSAAEVRAVFTKNGGNLGETGSAEFNFERVGVITYSKEGKDFERLLELAINADAKDLEEDEDGFYVITDFTNLHKIEENLSKNLGQYQNMEIIWRPLSYVELDDEKKEKFNKLIDSLEDLDDVQNVYHNANIE